MSTAIVVLAGLLVPGAALADGDPANDVLASQLAFVPWDVGVPATEQDQLLGMLRAAARSGFRIRVALIASASDLGSVTELWRQPQSYAQFLGQELSLLYGGRVLVVMPDGSGFYQPGRVPRAEQLALAATRPARGTGLAAAAVITVRRLAAASGRALALPSATATRNSRSVPGSVDTLSWLVFAVGAALIALAWTGSLRAQPFRRPFRRAPLV